MILSSVNSRRAAPGQSRATRNRFRELRGMGPALNFRRIKILPGETLIIHYCATGRLEIRRQNSGNLTAARTTKPTAPLSPGMVNTPACVNRDAGSRMVYQRVSGSAMPISEQEFDELAALRKSQCWDTPIFHPSHPSYRRVMARLRELEAKERAASG
jgi:hypothetical protein